MQQAGTPSEIAAALRASGARRIAIDGTDGSGKSTLAAELGAQLGARVINLDDFVTKNLGAYIPNLDKLRLSNVLTASNFSVLEGICVLQALDVVSWAPDALVYVKRMSHGHWCDKDELDPQLSIEEHLAELRAMVKPMAEAFGESGELGLAEEIVRYHAAYRPHHQATIEYLRTDA